MGKEIQKGSIADPLFRDKGDGGKAEHHAERHAPQHVPRLRKQELERLSGRVAPEQTRGVMCEMGKARALIWSYAALPISHMTPVIFPQGSGSGCI